MKEKLNVAVIGAGRWSRSAHLPGYVRSPYANLKVICDLNIEQAEECAREFNIPEVITDYRELLVRDDIDVIDVCTRDEHDELVFAIIEAGKHCLCEKPVAHRAEDVWKAQSIAESKGLKTKVGLTFRYAPAIQYMYHLIKEGAIGQPYIFNGYEQNCQWLNPDNPADKRIHTTPPKVDLVGGFDPDPRKIEVSSLEGYGAPIIDIGLLATGADMTDVVGVMKNFVPYRRRTNLDTVRDRINMDDGTAFIGEMSNGALSTIQTSYVTVGNYPGIEARIYGEKGAIICRLVDEFGECQTMHMATPDHVEFRRIEIPDKFFPPGYQKGENWPSLFYANLIHNFMEEIVHGSPENQGNFAQSARVQEIINAVEQSHRSRSWVSVESKRNEGIL